MIAPAHLALADAPVVQAPDGSTVHVLCRLAGGSMACFSLEAGQVATAVRHRTVDEIWYVVAGRGEMWRSGPEGASTIALVPGVSLTIPVGCGFQFRAAPDSDLAAVAITMPPWPGEGEVEPVPGPWEPTFSI